MATTEHIGALTLKDIYGNKQKLYPITKQEAVEGLDATLEILNNTVSEKVVNVNKLAESHSSRHSIGGEDPISPASIGAVANDSSQAPDWLATLDSNGKVHAYQTQSRIITADEGGTYSSWRSIRALDSGCLVSVNSEDNFTIKIPYEGQAESVGAEWVFLRMGAGAVIFEGEDGVTLYSIGGASATKTLNEQYGVAYVKCIAPNAWLLSGALEKEKVGFTSSIIVYPEKIACILRRRTDTVTYNRQDDGTFAPAPGGTTTGSWVTKDEDYKDADGYYRLGGWTGSGTKQQIASGAYQQDRYYNKGIISAVVDLSEYEKAEKIELCFTRKNSAGEDFSIDIGEKAGLDVSNYDINQNGATLIRSIQAGDGDYAIDITDIGASSIGYVLIPTFSESSDRVSRCSILSTDKDAFYFKVTM